MLKAELRIAETQAKDIQIGQSAAIDTRNGVIPGHVTRIDPAVENGTVTVDVALDGALPRGARPDLTVDGAIELERMDDILFVGRPVFGQEESVVSLFKVETDGTHASRTRVSLGRASVNTIEVLNGPAAGRPRGPVRHVHLGSVRSGAYRVGPLSRVEQRKRLVRSRKRHV